MCADRLDPTSCIGMGCSASMKLSDSYTDNTDIHYR